MTVNIEYLLTSNSWGVRVGHYNGPDTSGAYRAGGNIRPPIKIHDVPSQYPALAREANVGGVIILEARIDESGNVSETRLLRSIPLLDQAAIDAVRQWKYATTLVNGVAVPVITTVTVNFHLRGVIRVQLTLPDGSTRTLELSPGGYAAIATPALGRMHFRAVRSASGGATLSIYDEDGRAHLGDVALQPDGRMVRSPTTPSFGIQLR